MRVDQLFVPFALGALAEVRQDTLVEWMVAVVVGSRGTVEEMAAERWELATVAQKGEEIQTVAAQAPALALPVVLMFVD